METKVIVKGKPIAKARPRFARAGKFIRTYNAQESEEGKFLLLAIEQINHVFEGPIELAMFFYMPRPKSHYGTGKNEGVLKVSAPIFHTTKPDIDNLIKFPLDILNEVAWEDDRQIVKITAVKEYSEIPRTEILIKEVML
ncbi:MAG TPA: RusA family crossover junction endodeoxyribonuclease [Bacteroidales bacterium]|nr:RusA family crossover junction endodeoxyribonuclease [Bacteroidales bacterium]